jgi:hypothetical protein
MKSALLVLLGLLSCSCLIRAEDAQDPKPDKRFKTDLLVVVAHAATVLRASLCPRLDMAA